MRRRLPAAKFKNGFNAFARKNRRFVERNRVFFDARNMPVRAYKDYIQRNLRVFHPKSRVLRRIEKKEHARAFREAFTKHKTVGFLLRRLGDLDIKRKNAAFRAFNDDPLFWKSRRGLSKSCKGKKKKNEE